MTKGYREPPPGWNREEAQALAGLLALFAITAAWWALALWPVEPGGPVWLERTRYVCFGIGESGLPDPGGWIGLIGGPLGMLLILLAGWRSSLRGLIVRARTTRPVAAVLAMVAFGALLLVVGAGVRIQQADEVDGVSESGGLLPPRNYPRLDRPAPRLRLTAQHGNVLELAELRGTPILVTFAYAHCRTVCPVVVSDVLAARQTLVGSEDEPAVLVVTLDPWRDTPSRLPAMARSWRLPEHGAWVLTGSVEDVEAVLDAWEVPRTRNSSSGELVHPSLVYVVDREGRLAFTATAGGDALVSLLRRL